MRSVGIIGLGKYLPETIVTNEDFVKRGLDTSDEWIKSRTGIEQRRLLDKSMSSSDMGYEAAKMALKESHLTAQDIDLIIVATTSQDHPGFPSNACLLQERLGMRHIGAFDLAAACSGFNYALTTATQYVQNGFAKHVLVVATDCLSRYVDWEDRSICILFGDGAGAAVIGAVEEGHGILFSSLHADGSASDILKIEGGGSRQGLSSDVLESKSHLIHMDGKSVFKMAVNCIIPSIKEDLKQNNLSSEDISWFIFHQANYRIIQSACEKLGIPKEKTINTLYKYGNTSAASIPIILSEAHEDGKFKKGQLIYIIGFGAGFTWGSNLIRWSK